MDRRPRWLLPILLVLVGAGVLLVGGAVFFVYRPLASAGVAAAEVAPGKPVITAQTTPAATGQGQPAAPPIWSAKCTGEGRQSLDCSIEERAYVTQTGQLLTTVLVRVPADSKAPAMMVTAPLGLYLPAGIAIDVDGGSSQKLDLQTCDANGCYAGLPLSDDMVRQMSGGKALNVSFQSVNRQPIKVPLSLDGFAAGLKKIQ